MGWLAGSVVGFLVVTAVVVLLGRSTTAAWERRRAARAAPPPPPPAPPPQGLARVRQVLTRPLAAPLTRRLATPVRQLRARAHPRHRPLHSLGSVVRAGVRHRRAGRVGPVRRWHRPGRGVRPR